MQILQIKMFIPNTGSYNVLHSPGVSLWPDSPLSLPMAGSWMIFKVPSIPNHFVILALSHPASCTLVAVWFQLQIHKNSHLSAKASFSTCLSTALLFPQMHSLNMAGWLSSTVHRHSNLERSSDTTSDALETLGKTRGRGRREWNSLCSLRWSHLGTGPCPLGHSSFAEGFTIP